MHLPCWLCTALEHHVHCVLKRFRIPARSVDALADHPSAVPSDDLEQVKLHKAGHVLVESSVKPAEHAQTGIVDLFCKFVWTQHFLLSLASNPGCAHLRMPLLAVGGR